MNIMTISNGKPNPQKCYTEKYGTYQCMLSIREQLMRKFGTAIDDDVIDNDSAVTSAAAADNIRFVWHSSGNACPRFPGVRRQLRCISTAR